MASRKPETEPGYISLRGLDNPVYGYGRMFTAIHREVHKLAKVVDNASVKVWMTTPNLVTGWMTGQKKVVFTMWETDTLSPNIFIDHLPYFDQVVVPCEHNRLLFAQHHPNVSVVNLGVDSKFYKPGPDREPNKKFVFMAGGSHWLRKGLDVVVRAFTKLNTKGAELVVKCTSETIGGIPAISHPNITIHDRFITQEADRELYYASDCYIAASRGEGWGLMPLQAMCMGIPTIISDTSGHREFSKLATRVVATEPRPVYAPPYYLDGNWDEPDFDGLVEAMTWMLDNREDARIQAASSISKAAKYTWANSAKQLLKATGTGVILKNAVEVPAPEPTVLLRVRKRVRAEIGRHRVDLEPGVDHWVPANVKKVITDAGYAI